MTGQPGRSGGPRENSGGKREGAGRPPGAHDVTLSPARINHQCHANARGHVVYRSAQEIRQELINRSGGPRENSGGKREGDRVVQSFADYLVVVVTAIAYSVHD